MRRVNGNNIRQLIRDHTNSIDSSLKLILKDGISPNDAKFWVDFSKCIEDHISQKLINLCNSFKLILGYYSEADRNITTENTKDKPNFINGIDKFLFEFNLLYMENKYFRGGLLCCLLHHCVTKLSGSTNPHYDYSALNLSLALYEN